jgi:hypothetical protein
MICSIDFVLRRKERKHNVFIKDFVSLMFVMLIVLNTNQNINEYK